MHKAPVFTSSEESNFNGETFHLRESFCAMNSSSTGRVNFPEYDFRVKIIVDSSAVIVLIYSSEGVLIPLSILCKTTGRGWAMKLRAISAFCTIRWALMIYDWLG